MCSGCDGVISDCDRTEFHVPLDKRVPVEPAVACVICLTSYIDKVIDKIDMLLE